MGISSKRVTIFVIETIAAIITLTGVTMVIETIGVGPTFHLEIGKLIIEIVVVVRRELRICCRR